MPRLFEVFGRICSIKASFIYQGFGYMVSHWSTIPSILVICL